MPANAILWPHPDVRLNRSVKRAVDRDLLNKQFKLERGGSREGRGLARAAERAEESRGEHQSRGEQANVFS
jgi:hypothetical protein